MAYNVVMRSVVYEEESFGPYPSLKAANEAIKRLKRKAASLKDCIERTYSIEPEATAKEFGTPGGRKL